MSVEERQTAARDAGLGMCRLLIKNLGAPEFAGVVAPAVAANACDALGWETETLVRALVPVARTYALPPISHFQVGAVLLGASGALYLGANMEFPNVTLGASVHAEQAAVSNAHGNGESHAIAIATSAPPCGHCRQFLNELPQASAIRVAIGTAGAVPLSDLLPLAFGPADLGLTADPLGGENHQLTAPGMNEVDAAALHAARKSHAPYSTGYAGVALRSARAVVTGSYLENAAFNPSLPAMAAALVALRLRDIEPTDVTAATLVAAAGPVDHATQSSALLRAAGSAAPLRTVGAIATE